MFLVDLPKHHPPRLPHPTLEGLIMSFLRRNKQQPLDLTPDEPPDRVSRRLAEIAEELQGIEQERLRLLSKQCERAGVSMWAGFARDEPTAMLPVVQPRTVQPGS